MMEEQAIGLEDYLNVTKGRRKPRIELGAAFNALISKIRFVMEPTILSLIGH